MSSFSTCSPFYVDFSLAQLAYNVYWLLTNSLLVYIYIFKLQLTHILYCCSHLLLINYYV